MWPSPLRSPAVLGASLALALLGIAVPGAGAQAVATACGATHPGRHLVTPTAVTAAVVAGQRRNERPQPRWAVAAEPSMGRVLAEPSSGLHAVGSWHLARQGLRAFGGACAPSATAIAQGAAYATAVGVAKEIVDGWYTGFSRADLVANSVGIALAAAQATLPALEAVQPTISLPMPAGVVAGAGAIPAAWLSASVHDLLPERAARWWPAAVRLSAGYRAGSAQGASQVMLGLDLDARRLPGSHPVWRRVLTALGHTRLPGPSLVMGAGGTRVALVW